MHRTSRCIELPEEESTAVDNSLASNETIQHARGARARRNKRSSTVDVTKMNCYIVLTNEGRKERKRERKRGRHSLRSLHRDEESGLLFFPSSPAASSPYYVSGPALLPVSSRSPPSPPLSLAPSLLILRLVLRSAREARVLPVPIVSCMINDRVDLSPSPAAYASFRALDASIDREGGGCETHGERGGIFGVTKGKLERTR